MPLKCLDDLTDAELKHELRLCTDADVRAAIITRLRERLRERVAELANDPTLIEQCTNDELTVLLQVATSQTTRDDLARVLWARQADEAAQARGTDDTR